VRTISEDAFKRETTDKNGEGTDAFYLSRIPVHRHLKKLTDRARNCCPA
jgi:hemolysin D